MQLLYVFLYYLLIINLFASVITVSDKRRAIKGKYRIPEKALFLLALLGGAVGEYFAMKLARHKTLHKKFMIGLPVIILLQVIFAILVLYFINVKRVF